MKNLRQLFHWVLPMLLASLTCACGSPANEQATLPPGVDPMNDSLRLHVTEQDRTNIDGREDVTPIGVQEELADTTLASPRAIP